MRPTNFCVLVVAIAMLCGCAGKSAVSDFEKSKAQQPHFLHLHFNNTYCRAYLIQNDTVKYEFSKTGTYEIAPGKYLFIGQCSNGYSVVPVTDYTAGDGSDRAAGAGTKVHNAIPGTISGPLK